MLTGAERLLWEASERALRQPHDRLALVLHLSRLTPPAPRSYHMRIARVLMQDSAARFDGQVFAMRNQDIVLLCNRSFRMSPNRPVKPSANPVTSAPGGFDTFAADPASLPAMLSQLFSADTGSARLTSLWSLEHDAASLLGYLGGRAAGPASVKSPDDESDAVLSVAALQGILARAPLSDLLVQQTGMSLDRNRGKGLAQRLVPAFRSLQLSLDALDLGPLVSRATSDPFLFRHLATGFDARIVTLLAEDLAAGGPLTRVSVRNRLPIHLALGFETILSPGFAQLLQQAASRGVRLGVSFCLMQACAELDLIEHARRVLMPTGTKLILAQVDAVALGMVRPTRLRPDLMKIVWSPALAEPGGWWNELAEGFNLAHLVLQDVDTQQGLAWGHARGISLFQGVLLDQVQAATRMSQCSGASSCTMRQCGSRSSTAGVAGRAGCTSPGLLDPAPSADEELAALCS